MTLATLATVVVVLGIAGPAAAQEEEHDFADHAAEECYDLLAEGGTIDDCQEAPNPLLPEVNEILWGGAAFLVLLLGMWKFGLPAVRGMMHTREERIRGDLEAAETAKTDAEGVKAQYERQLAEARTEAASIIEEARQAAEVVRRDLIARAEGEADEVRARAQADIANQRTQAMAQLRNDVAELSVDLAGRIVERNLDAATQRELVDSFIDQVGRSN
jgi:F-type H+-transporting ATPase subunit b